LFAFVFCFFSTPTDFSFHLTLAGASWSGALASEQTSRRQPTSRFRLFPSLLCSSISAVCLNLPLELEANRHRICTKKRAAAATVAFLLKL
jgi:hypothetical protein